MRITSTFYENNESQNLKNLNLKRRIPMKLKSSLVWVVVISLGILTGACTCGTKGEMRDGAFIHISHGTNDAHRVLMALQMADLMAADHDVLVYFDIQGVEVVLKDAADISFSHFPTSQTQLASLSQKGATLMACPGCLKAAGKTPADLAEGIEVADKDKFFSFTKGRILTLDY
jgi:predicted peroxiredoxin